MPRPKKEETPEIEGLVGRAFLSESMCGQIVEKLTDEFYLIQPFEKGDAGKLGMLIVHIEDMSCMLENAWKGGFRFFDSYAEMEAFVKAMAEKKDAAPPPKQAPPPKSVVQPTETKPAAAPPPAAPPPAPSTPAVEKPKAEKPAEKPPEAKPAAKGPDPLDNIRPLLGKNGIIGATIVEKKNKKYIEVTVAADKVDEAIVALPEKSGGLEVQIRSNAATQEKPAEKAPTNGVDTTKPAEPAKTEKKDETPY